MKGLSPLESWLFILKNMGNFAGKPEDMGEYVTVVLQRLRVCMNSRSKTN